MFRPNLTITLRRIGQDFDVYGHAQLLPAETMRCAVIKLRDKSQQTTVRADSSGSRGFGDERVVESKLLLPISSRIKAGDVLTVDGLDLQVDVVHPRHRATGVLDHYEVECVAWQSK